jgi:sulfatase maturation enzyme AslB (radical SAM superfamily)
LNSINDWFRWPSKFDQIIENLQIYNKWFKDNANVTLKIHCVINAINVLYLKEFVSYIKINFPNWEFSWDWLTEPSWQSVSILPFNTKEKLIEEFKNLELNPFRITIDRLKDHNNNNWNDFKRNVLELSNNRKLDFFKMVDKFTTIWDQ